MVKKNLIDYRTPGSTSFVGRPQGEEVREKLGMEGLDISPDEVELIIPGDTTSFNPSFFLGLLYNSIKKLGVEGFKRKYSLIVETENEELKNAIKKNIDDGFRNASNSINKNDGLKAFGF
jgi:hypothetical protein